jgi:hypothetical protein
MVSIPSFEDSIRILQRKYPAVTEMWNSGSVTEAAVRTIYPQWFKNSDDGTATNI